MRRLPAAALLLLIFPSLLVAQPLADRVPADAIAYVGWQGSAALGEAYAKSNLKQVLAESNLPQLFEDFLPRLAERFEKEEDDADAKDIAKTLRVVTSLASPMWRRPWALYFAGIDFEAELPRLALIVDAGQEAQALHDAAKQAFEATGEDVPVELGVHAGRFVVLTIGMDVSAPFGALLGGPQAVAPAPALAAHKSFQSGMAQVQKQPAIAFYVDLDAVWNLVGKGFAADGDAQTWPKAREALGLANLKRFAFSAGFDGQNWAAQAFIEAPAPRAGVAGILGGQPLSDEILRTVPQTATWMTATRFDLHQILADIRSALGKGDPEAQRAFDQGMGMVRTFSSIDLQADLFEPLGPEWTLYIDPINGGGGNYLGFIAVNRLDDPQRLERSLAKLEPTINNAIAGQLADEEVTIAVRQRNVGDLNVHFVSLPAIAPAWAIRDGHLYLGLYPQSVVSAAAHVAEKRPTILQNKEFVSLRTRLAQDRGVNSIAFADLPQTAGSAYPTSLAMLQFGIGIADMMGMELPPLIIPPLHRIQRHLGTAGSVSWTDDTGWHYRTTSPFPGSEIMTTDANVVVAQQAMMASILVPAFTAARERANRVKCASNLRQVGRGVLMFANDNKGKYPADLGVLAVYLKGELDPTIFGCPGGGGNHGPGPDVLGDPEKLREWVNENTRYIYVGAKVTGAAGPDAILVYEYDDNHEEEGMNILFNDGHVEWFTYDKAMELMEKLEKDN